MTIDAHHTATSKTNLGVGGIDVRVDGGPLRVEDVDKDVQHDDADRGQSEACSHSQRESATSTGESKQAHP